MFTPASRAALRDWLIGMARTDRRVTAAAVLGSGARGREDRWSDIDLALRLAHGEDAVAVADSWAVVLGRQVRPVAHLDLWARGGLYRVFLLPDTLQVDVSFWSADAFAAHGPAFRLVFGEANEPAHLAAPSARTALGMAWLYALHARSSIARGRAWQAVYMVNTVRDHVVQLACLRHGLPAVQGRGVDDLPAVETARLRATLPRSTDGAELRRAFAEVAAVLVAEARYVDPDGVEGLERVLAELVRTSNPDEDD
jgi:predicted nucleotidyltransferase